MPREKRAVSVTYHHGDLRRALLDAALALLDEGSEPSLRAVARRAGVSHTAPYHHFADRRALMGAVAEEAFVGLRQAMLDAASAAPPDPAIALREIGVAYVEFAVGNPARFRLMFSSELAERSDLEGMQAASDAAYGVLVDAVGRMHGHGVPSKAISLIALGAWSTVHGLSMLILDNQVPGAEQAGAAARIAREVLGGRRP